MQEYGPIQQLPPGLLSLLGLKVAGKNPDTLLSAVTPTIELFDWYLQITATGATRQLDGITNGLTGLIGATANDLVVPNLEWWYVHNFSIITAASVGNNVRLLPAVVYNSPSMTSILPAPNISTGAGNAAPAWSADRPFWAPPGTTFMVWVMEAAVAAGPVVPSLRLRYTPLRV